MSVADVLYFNILYFIPFPQLHFPKETAGRVRNAMGQSTLWWLLYPEYKADGRPYFGTFKSNVETYSLPSIHPQSLTSDN